MAAKQAENVDRVLLIPDYVVMTEVAADDMRVVVRESSAAPVSYKKAVELRVRQEIGAEEDDESLRIVYDPVGPPDGKFRALFDLVKHQATGDRFLVKASGFRAHVLSDDGLLLIDGGIAVQLDGSVPEPGIAAWLVTQSDEERDVVAEEAALRCYTGPYHNGRLTLVPHENGYEVTVNGQKLAYVVGDALPDWAEGSSLVWATSELSAKARTVHLAQAVGEVFVRRSASLVATMRPTEDVKKVIRREGRRWVLYSRDGKKVLGRFDTRNEAVARERQINYFRIRGDKAEKGTVISKPDADFHWYAWTKAEAVAWAKANKFKVSSYTKETSFHSFRQSPPSRYVRLRVKQAGAKTKPADFDPKKPESRPVKLTIGVTRAGKTEVQSVAFYHGGTGKALGNGALQVGYLHKAMVEKQYTFGVLYKATNDSKHVVLDAHEEWVTADVLQQSQWDYVRKGDRSIWLQHKLMGAVRLGEWVDLVSWPQEVRCTLKLPSGETKNTVIPAHSTWMGVLWNDAGWKLVKAGKIRGFSMGGSARRRRRWVQAVT